MDLKKEDGEVNQGGSVCGITWLLSISDDGARVVSNQHGCNVDDKV